MTQLLDANKVYSDDLYFFEHLIQIEDRNGRAITFILNPAQEILHDNDSHHNIVVKAGQLGITTFYLAKNFKRTLTTPNTTSVIVAHEEFLTQRLLHRTDVWYNRIPPVIHMQMPDGTHRAFPKPRRQRNSTFEKSFPAINSVFYIGTARAFVFGRGEPIHNFHASEVAFWPDVDRILDPTLHRVPIETGTVVLESTPNGEVDTKGKPNRFFELVTEAYNDPNTLWRLHQLPWWLEPSYRLPIGSPASLPLDRLKIANFTEEEKNLILAAGWNDEEADERIRWRRMKIKTSKDLFWQEFFEDITSCFLVTGALYYDVEELGRLNNSIRPFQYMWGKTKVWYAPDSDWEYPNYLISVDPGQGKHTVSVALVWRLDPPTTDFPMGRIRHEATLAGLFDPVTFAPMVMELGYYYRTAKIAPERNGHGMAFCAQILSYPNLYYQHDIVAGQSTKTVGWKTTGAPRVNGGGTKTYMIEELNHALPQIITHDEAVIAQLRNVRLTSDGKIQMPKWDDYHDAAAIMAATKSTAHGNTASGLAFSKRLWG